MAHDEMTTLLQRAHEGDAEAMNEVARRIQDDLTRLAGGKMFGRFGGKPTTLAPHDLVAETFIKLLGQRNEFRNREHLFAVATKIMDRVLLDYAKSRSRDKRGGPDKVMVTLGALNESGEDAHLATISDLSDAMAGLAEHDAAVAKIFKLREVWGLSSQEVADMLGVSKSKVDRDWRFARAWLRSRLEAG